MATWSERWAEDARSCPSMPAEGGCRGLAQVGTASGSAAKAWKLPRRGRATLRGKPRRARGVPRAAAPTLFASEGGGLQVQTARLCGHCPLSRPHLRL